MTKPSRSILCAKISICELIETCDVEQCIDVIRWLHDAGLSNEINLNKFLIQTILGMKQSHKKLDTVEQKMKTITTNSKQQKPHSVITKAKKGVHLNINCAGDEEIVFPLLGLPIDVISTTTLYLNAQDIFQFERCCRLFYQMINNSSYLNQSNSFNTFKLTNKNLDIFTKEKTTCTIELYKYCKIKTLMLNISDTGNWYYNHVRRARGTFCMDMLLPLLKSMETLKIQGNSLQLLDKIKCAIPMKRLFDTSINDDYQFKKIEFGTGEGGHYHRDLGNGSVRAFRVKYNTIKDTFRQEKKDVRILDCVKIKDTETVDILLINSKHMWLNDTFGWLSKENASNNCNYLQCLTFERSCGIGFTRSNNYNDYNGVCEYKPESMNIETIRLIDFSSFTHPPGILNDKTTIETMNLPNSVRNLTLHLIVNDEFLFELWIENIQNLLQKEYYYNLKNINILIEIPSYFENKEDINPKMEILITMLEKNIKILKHQFDKFNIGLKCVYGCDVLEWNEKMNKKQLNGIKTKWERLKQIEETTRRNLEIFEELKNMWI